MKSGHNMNRIVVIFLVVHGGLSAETLNTWNGSTSSMNAGSNWSTSSAPSSGDPLNFPPTATLNLTPNNDIPGTYTFYDITSNKVTGATYSITLTTPAASTYALSGNAFQVPTSGAALLQIGGPGTSASSVANNIGLNSGALNIVGARFDQISGIISGTGVPFTGTPPKGITVYPGSVNIVGSVEFLGSNTYSGSTYISAGTLRLGASNTLPSATDVQIVTGGILDLNNFSQTIGLLSSDASAVIVTKSGSLTITNSGTNTFAGSIELTTSPPYSGSGGTIALGAGSTGTLTISGANSYSSIKNIGNTTVTAGTLQASQTTSFGTNSNLTVASGATLNANGNTLTFNTISGAGTIQLNPGGSIIIAHGGTTFSGPITIGTGATDQGINFTGSETLTLSGANTYVGPTTISGGGVLVLSNLAGTTSSSQVNIETVSGGTLKFGSAFSPSAPLSLAINGTLDINGNNVTWSGNILGGGSLTLINSGSSATLTLTGNNAYSGGTVVNAGTLLLGSAAAYYSPAAGTPLSIASGATMNMNNFPITISTFSGGGTLNLGSATATVQGGTTGSSSTFSGRITGTGGLTFSGNGKTLVLTGSPVANNYSGATTINGAGTLSVTSSGLSSSTSGVVFSGAGGTLQAAGTLTGAVPITLTTNGTVDTNGFAVGWTGTISGSGSLIKSGSNTLTLTPSSPNTYTGQTRVEDGTLKAGNSSAFGSTSLFDIQPGGVLDLNNINFSVAQLIGDPGSSVTLGSATLTITGGVDIAPYYGVISGTGNIIASGGAPTFMGTNTYTGTTTIQGDATWNTLNLGSTSSVIFGTGGGILQIGSDSSSSATLAFNDVATISTNTFDLTISGNISAGAGASFTKIGQGTLTLTGTNSFANTLQLEGGVLNVTSASLGTPSSLVFQQFCGTLQSSGAITKSFPITVATTGIFDTTGGAITMNGDIEGVGGVTKTGTGTLTLGGTNSYAGLTTILQGTLNATATSLPLPATGFAPTLLFDGLSGSGIFQAGGAFSSFPTVVFFSSGTIDTNSHNITSASVVAGNTTATFTKAGSGTLTLSGANLYTGPTHVTGGTLQAGVASTSTSGAFGVDSAVTLDNTSGVTLALNNFSTTIGSLSGGGSTGGNVTLGSGTLTITNGNSDTFAGSITGTGGLTLTGGTQTLTGTNNFSGTTTITSGATLQFQSATATNTLGAISNSGTLFTNELLSASSYTQSSAASLAIDFPSLSPYGQIVASGTVTIDPTTTLTITNTGHVTPSGTVTLLQGSSLSGTFTSVVNPFSKGTLQYTATQVNLVFSSSGCQSAWNHAGSGNWGVTGNWTPACYPGINPATDEDTATFATVGAGSATITLADGSSMALPDLTLYSLNFTTASTNYSIVEVGGGTTKLIMDGNPSSNPNIAISAGTHTINVPIQFNQNGTLHLNSGTLTLGAVANITATAGVALTISGTSGTLSNSANITPPTVSISGGTINNSGQISPATALNISGGTITNLSGATLGSATAPLTISGGSVANDAGATLQATTLTLSSGSLTTKDPISVSTYSQSGGTLTLDFPTLSPYGHITATGALNLGGALVVTNSGSVVAPTSGTITLLQGTTLGNTTFSSANTSVFPTATLAYSATQVYLNFNQSGPCNGIWTSSSSGNWGTSSKWQACVPGLSGASSAQDTATFRTISGATTISVTLADAGGNYLPAVLNQLIFSATTPSYSIIQTLGQGSITFEGTAPAQIRVSAGSHTINAPLIATVNTTIALSNGASLTLAANGNVTGSSGVGVTVSGSSGTLNNSATVHPPSVTLAGGTINNSGSITPASALNITGGTVNNLASATIGTASTPLTISGGTLVNETGATLTASALTLSSGSLTTENQISLASYTQSGGTLTLDFPTLSPYGNIDASGALSLGGALVITNSGSVSPSPGQITLLQGSSLTGSFSSITNPFDATVRTSTASHSVYLNFGGCHGIWTSTSSSDDYWGLTTNWSSTCAPGLNPASSDDTATFNKIAGLPSELTVTLANSAGNAALDLTALYQLNFNTASTNFTIGQFSSSGSITMDSIEEPALITVSAGSHTVNAPIILGVNTDLTLTDGILTFGSAASVTGAQTLTIVGDTGTWINGASITPSAVVMESGTIDNFGSINPATLAIGAGASDTLSITNFAAISPTGSLAIAGAGSTSVTNYLTMTAGSTFTIGFSGSPTVFNSNTLSSTSSFLIAGGDITNSLGGEIFSSSSSLTISGGTIENSLFGRIYATSGQTMTISGGTISNLAASVLGSLSGDDLAGELVFSGGEVTNAGYALAQLLTISGGTVINQTDGVLGIATADVNFTSGVLNNSGIVLADNYTQSGSGQLEIGVLSASQFGTVTASGSASLGGSLVVNALPGFSMTNGQTANLLTAVDGLNGSKFASYSFQNFPSSLIPSLNYLPEAVQLNLTAAIPAHFSGSTSVVFTSVNQHNLLLMRKSLQLRERFPTGQSNSTNLETASNDLVQEEPLAQDFDSQIQRKQEQLAGKTRISPQPKPWSFYAGPIASCGSVKSKGDQIGLGYYSVGGLMGFDSILSDEETRPYFLGLGVAADYRKKIGVAKSHFGTVSVDKVHATVYSTLVPKNIPELAFNGLGGFAYTWENLHRKTGMNKEETAIGKPNTALFDLLVDIEYTFSKTRYAAMPDNIRVIPMANIQYVYAHISKYTEHGAGIYDLQVPSQTPQSLSTTLGARFDFFKTASNHTICLEIDAAWQREYLNNTREVSYTAFNITQTPTFGTAIGIGRNSCLLGLDLLSTIYDRLQVEASCDITWNSIFIDAFFYLGIGGDF